MKEFVIRLIYIEMLGQDASFAYIKAVELCASTSILQKKAGYLATSLCLSPEHEFRFMLVNQIQRDMNSSNVLEICTALTAVNKLVTVDMIPAVIGEVAMICYMRCYAILYYDINYDIHILWYVMFCRCSSSSSITHLS